MRLIAILIVVLAIFSEGAFAASLHGTVYDIDLNTVNNAIIEVNSVPMQRTLSKEGQYSFELSPGKYVIQGYIKDGDFIIASTEENVTIDSDGSFVFDLFLYPEIQDKDLLGGSDITVEDVNYADSSSTIAIWVLVIVLIIIAGAAYYFMYFKKKKKEVKADVKEEKAATKEDATTDNNLDKIVEIIKREGGRTTQKDIRKEIPYSEAKISLMISELEHKGVIERIKKGRGNIIVLKK